jgi:uncharacterized membrane protein
MAVMAWVRAVLSLVAAVIAFVLVFLAIFVPMLIHDIHTAPHDGQGGLGGFVLGVPIAAMAAFATGICFYHLSKRRGWFQNRDGDSVSRS